MPVGLTRFKDFPGSPSKDLGLHLVELSELRGKLEIRVFFFPLGHMDSLKKTGSKIGC